MKYLKLLLLMAFSAMAIASQDSTVSYIPERPTEYINSKMSTIETRVRQAAVRVTTRQAAVRVTTRQAAVRVTTPFMGGHGSGSYIKYKDVYIVITAQHVTDGPLGKNYLVNHKSESHVGTLIYADPHNDIAVLYLTTPFRTIEPMKFNPLDDVAGVGANVVYSGYPSTHKLMSFTGRVAGYENGPGIGKHIILQTYGWFGCSGSVIYTLKGEIVGVLYGVDVEYYPNTQVQENMIWVAPINKLKIDKAMGAFCRGYPGKRPKACR